MLSTRDLVAGYDERTVLDGLDLDLPTDAFTVIVGPNACGKSTLLRTMARLLTPRRGTVLLDGTAIRDLPTREVARRLGRAAAEPAGARGHHRGRPGRPRPAALPAVVAAVVGRRTRPAVDRGDGAGRRRRRSPTGRSTPSPAGSGSGSGSR